jgi:predicted nucleotidyltransferase
MKPKFLQVIRTNEPELLHIIEQYGGRNIVVFGSVARGDEDEESDVDLLIDLRPEVDIQPLVIQQGVPFGQ